MHQLIKKLLITFLLCPFIIRATEDNVQLESVLEDQSSQDAAENSIINEKPKTSMAMESKIKAGLGALVAGGGSWEVLGDS